MLGVGVGSQERDESLEERRGFEIRRGGVIEAPSFLVTRLQADLGLRCSLVVG